jgi:hypothetical protein
MTLPSEDRQTELAAAIEALRLCLRHSGPQVEEHDWGGYWAYGAPQIFAFLWPQPTHVSVGLLQGSRLRPGSRRLLGHGPALRMLHVRGAGEVDAELADLLGRAAGMARRDALRD